MAEKIVSPGVFTNEIDASFLPAAIGDIGAVVIGPTVKGPALVPTVVESYGEFQALFGDVFRSGSNFYQYLTSHTAKNYLQYSGKLTVVRVMAEGYAKASATLSGSLNPVVVGGGTPSTDGKFTAGASLIPGASASIGNGDDLAIDNAVWFKFVDDAANHTNTFNTIYVTSGSGVINTTMVNFTDAINNNKSLHGLQISASNYEGVGITNISMSIGGNQQKANQIVHGNSLLGYFPLDQGNTGFADISPGAAGDATSGTDYGYTGQHGILSEASTATYTQVLKLHLLSDGAEFNNASTVGINEVLLDGTENNIRWAVTTSNVKKGNFSIVIRRGSDSSKRQQILESWEDLSMDSNASNYVARKIGNQYNNIAGTTSDPYLQMVGEYQNKSKYIRVEVLRDTPNYLDENGNVQDETNKLLMPAVGSGSWGGSFSGGSDGNIEHPITFNENITNTSAQGLNLAESDNINQYHKALNLIANPDEYDINLIFVPGIVREHAQQTGIITKAINVAESRGDCFAVVDPVQYSTTALASVTEQAKAVDSSYAAMYHPWIQVPDQSTGKSVWVPPSVAVAGIYAYNDKVGYPWNAPAGLNRGVITTAIQAQRKLTNANRDELYEQSINPIATFPGQGVTVWGQKTLQKKASALDRINVRRLLIKVKKFIASSSRFLVFEQNNSQTRAKFLNIANPYLEQVQAQSGLSSFKVIMDDTNNTPDTIDRNILYGQILLQPTKTAEFIVLDFTIQRSGAAFPE